MTDVQKPDWERIELLYRAGTKSIREIAAEAGVSHTAIQKRASKGEWTRDLKAKVQSAADAKVAKALVAKEVAAKTKVTETVAIDVEATVQARIRIAHRADIARGRGLAMKLMAELEHQTDNDELYEKLFDALHEVSSEEEGVKDRFRKLNDAFQRAMSVSGRADTLKKLAETLRILIDKEREAFGIVAPSGADGAQTPLAEAISGFLGSLHQAGSKLPIAKRP